MFVPSLGALLARMMVTELGGRWQPRRNLEQTQVILGDRAWLPFLRVNHFVQSRSSAMPRVAANPASDCPPPRP
jgi:hypothetical protein